MQIWIAVCLYLRLRIVLKDTLKITFLAWVVVLLFYIDAFLTCKIKIVTIDKFSPETMIFFQKNFINGKELEPELEQELEPQFLILAPAPGGNLSCSSKFLDSILKFHLRIWVWFKFDPVTFNKLTSWYRT